MVNSWCQSVFPFFHRGYEKPVFRHWRKSVFCDYFSFQFPWWKKLYSYLGHHVFLSRIPFQPSGKALGLKSYPRKKKTASAVRNYYFKVFSFFFSLLPGLHRMIWAYQKASHHMTPIFSKNISIAWFMIPEIARL